MVIKSASLEAKKEASRYNSQWRARHRKQNTDIARRLRDRENYYANRAKETLDGYCRFFLANIKARAKRKGLPFDLTLDDLIIPEFCPILGIRLVKRRGKFADESPSVDRIVPALGYVKGNVTVISYRANRIKCHASLAELRAIVGYMEAMEQ